MSNARQTILFVLVVTLVSGTVSFLLTALAAGSPNPRDPTFASLAIGMAAGCVFLLFGGNRRMTVADPETRRHALEEIAPRDGSARLIVVRESRIGMLVGVDLLVDGTAATQLRSPRFAVFPLAPGRHEVVAAAQGRRTNAVVIDLAAGATAALRVSATLGGLRLVEEQDGPTLRAALRKVPMVETARIDATPN